MSRTRKGIEYVKASCFFVKVDNRSDRPEEAPIFWGMTGQKDWEPLLTTDKLLKVFPQDVSAKNVETELNVEDSATFNFRTPRDMVAQALVDFDQDYNRMTLRDVIKRIIGYSSLELFETLGETPGADFLHLRSKKKVQSPPWYARKTSTGDPDPSHIYTFKLASDVEKFIRANKQAELAATELAATELAATQSLPQVPAQAETKPPKVASVEIVWTYEDGEKVRYLLPLHLTCEQLRANNEQLSVALLNAPSDRFELVY